jgi:hypothetical protein
MTQANDRPHRIENLETDSLNLRLMASALLASIEAHQRESAQQFEQHNQRMNEMAAMAARQQALIEQNQVSIRRLDDMANDTRQMLQLLIRRLIAE